MTAPQLIEVTPLLAAKWLGIEGIASLKEAIPVAFRGLALRDKSLREHLQNLQAHDEAMWRAQHDRIEAQRNICRGYKIARFARLMASGEWRPGEEEDAVVVLGDQVDGRCTTGRYRLMAVVKLGQPVPLRVQFVR